MRKTQQSALALFGCLAALLALFVSPAMAQLTGQPSAVPGEIVVKVPAVMTGNEVQALASGAGCRVVAPLAFSPGFYLLETATRSAAPQAPRATRAAQNRQPPTAAVLQAVAKLAATPGVLANPNYIVDKMQAPTTVTPDDPLYPQQRWHMDMIRMPEAWAIQIGVNAVVAAVLDTGIDVNHPDFKTADGKGSRILPGQNTLDPANPTTNVTDVDGHGTHVSGTLGATTNNGTGVVGVAGWNRDGVNVQILPVKVLGDTGTGTIAGLVAGINYATAQGVGVVNMSLGNAGSPSQVPTVVDAINAGISKGIIFVAAAGNDNSTAAFYPADIPGVIKVSAVGPNKRRAPYSNYSGPVAIAAPGGDQVNFGIIPGGVVSTVPTSFTGAEVVSPGYAAFQGTSMASPHVAGVVALLLAAGAAPDQIRPAIQETAEALDETPNFAGGNQYGAGLIDAYEALLRFTYPTVNIVGPIDIGAVLAQPLTIQLQVRLAAKLKAPSDLIVEVRTATTPSQLIRTFVGGQDFQIPTPDAARPSAPVTISLTLPTLPNGRYVITARINSTRLSEDQQFVSIGARVQPAGRTMFAVPYVLSPVQAGASPEMDLFGNVGFNLYRWNPVAGEYARWSSTGTPQDAGASLRAVLSDGSPITYETSAPTVSIAPVGLGYWLNLDTPQVLNLTGRTVSTPVAVRLFAANSGWNMIGTPFTFPVDWSAVTVVQGNAAYTLEQAVANNVVSPVLVGYNGTDYVYQLAPLGQLQPFNGYWVRALQDCTLVIPPVGGSRSRAQSTSANSEAGWRAQLAASVAGDRDGQNFFGQVGGAAAGEDKFDIAKPPSGAGHVYVRFAPGETTGRATALAFDMRPDGAKRQEWTALVTTDRENADVTLSWQGLGNAPKRARFTITDVKTSKVIPLKSRSSYVFRSGAAGETRAFKITQDLEATSGPPAITNVSLVSGRAVSGLSVRFTANRDGAVTGEVKTLGGKSVAHLTGATRAASSSDTVLRWNGRRQEDDSPVPAGPYLVEITVRTDDGQVARVKRLFQNLR